MIKKDKYRIIKRVYPDGYTEYIIQKRGWFRGWHEMWDAGNNSSSYATLEKARQHAWVWTGVGGPRDEVIEKL